MALRESDIAAEVVKFYEQSGHEVYQEVQTQSYGPRADIVVRTPGDTIAVVECKLALSWDLLDQAKAWKPFANAVFVAVPKSRPIRSRVLALDVCNCYLGLGVIEVGDHGVAIRRSPIAVARTDEALFLALAEGHKTHARAGESAGGQYTPFLATREALKAFVEANPGCTMQEAVAGIRHHYGREKIAVSVLSRELRHGRVPGVVKAWRQRLYPEGHPLAARFG
jgi:hypothetical protein